jgi:hypothetical protein
MANLQIDPKTARRLYPTAASELKEILIETFGKEFFKRNIIDCIDTFEDCLEETGRPAIPQFSDVPEDLRDFFKSTYQAVVICEAFNEGERLDLFNENVGRYYPYFTTEGSSARFRFNGTGCDHSLSAAGSGSRLSLKNDDLAKAVGKKFTAVFRDMQSK